MYNVFLCLVIVLILSHSEDSNEMQQYATFHMGLYCSRVPVLWIPVYKGLNCNFFYNLFFFVLLKYALFPKTMQGLE